MEHVNRESVDRRLARLREDWGEFPVSRRLEQAPPERFEEVVEFCRDGYTGGGYVWVVRTPDQAAPLTESMPDSAGEDGDRVLLVMSRGKDRWGPAGGGREDGETYEEAARREVQEETGVDCSITGVARAWRFTTASAGRHSVRLHSLFVVFEGRYEGGQVAIQPGELNGAAWFRELPGTLHPFAEKIAEQSTGDGRVR